MRGPLAALAPIWQVQRHRRPAAVARVEAAALGVRSRAALVAEARELRQRVAELERDLGLLASHVAGITERLAAGAAAGTVDDEGARQRARLAAIASYEHRLSALEERGGAPARRHQALRHREAAAAGA